MRLCWLKYLSHSPMVKIISLGCHVSKRWTMNIQTMFGRTIFIVGFQSIFTKWNQICIQEMTYEYPEDEVCPTIGRIMLITEFRTILLDPAITAP